MAVKNTKLLVLCPNVTENLLFATFFVFRCCFSDCVKISAAQLR